MSELISFESVRFNECIRPNEGGSIFLGYIQYAELVVLDVLDNDEDLRIGMPDLQVRITQKDDLRLDFPPKRGKDGEVVLNQKGAPVACYFTASRKTREALTEAVFALPEVKRAVKKARKQRDAA